MRSSDVRTIIWSVVLIFGGLFAVSMLWNMWTPNQLYKYTYTTTAVSGVQTINATLNASYSLTTSEATYPGLPFNVTLKATIDNTGTSSELVDIWLNGQKVATVNATVGNNTYAVIIPNLQLPATSNIVLASGITGSTLTGQIVSLTYPSKVETTAIGSTATNLANKTGDAFGIVMVALILSALFVVIRALRD